MRPLWAFIPGWILALVTVVGNGLVILLITKRRNLRTTTNWFVLSLAVTDFGVGAVYYPRVSFCSIHDETCVNEAVEIAYPVGVLFTSASATNLCALTLDRYLAPSFTRWGTSPSWPRSAWLCSYLRRGLWHRHCLLRLFYLTSFSEEKINRILQCPSFCTKLPSLLVWAVPCCSSQCGSSSSFAESRDETPRWLPSLTSTTNCSTEWHSKLGKLRQQKWSELLSQCASFTI